MSSYSVLLLGELIFMSNNEPLRALRIVFTMKSAGLSENEHPAQSSALMILKLPVLLLRNRV